MKYYRVVVLRDASIIMENHTNTVLRDILILLVDLQLIIDILMMFFSHPNILIYSQISFGNTPGYGHQLKRRINNQKQVCPIPIFCIDCNNCGQQQSPLCTFAWRSLTDRLSIVDALMYRSIIILSTLLLEVVFSSGILKRI